MPHNELRELPLNFDKLIRRALVKCGTADYRCGKGRGLRLRSGVRVTVMTRVRVRGQG